MVVSSISCFERSPYHCVCFHDFAGQLGDQGSVDGGVNEGRRVGWGGRKPIYVYNMIWSNIYSFCIYSNVLFVDSYLLV